MGKSNAIRQIRCPSCTNELAVANESGQEVCPYCGTTVSYDFSSGEKEENRNVSYVDNSTGIMIGSGNKDPKSVIIFLEDYLEKNKDSVSTIYDEVGVSQLSELVDEIKLSHGGEKETWELDYLSVYLPADLRIENILKIQKELLELIEEGESREKIYAKFDLIIEGRKASKDIRERVEFELTRAFDRFKKFGASSAEQKDYEKKLADLKKKFASLEKIPEALSDIEGAEKALKASDDRIANELREKGIDAENTYNSAVELEEKGELAQASYKYSLLNNYKDSYERSKRLNDYVIFGPLFVAGKTYHVLREHISDLSLATTKRQIKKVLKQEKKEQKTDEAARSYNGYDLVKIEDGKQTDEVEVKDFKKHLTTFGDLFYYISRKGTIHSYDLRKDVDNELETTAKHHEDILCEVYDNGRKILLLSDAKTLLSDQKEIEKEAKKRARKNDFEPQEANMFRIDILNLGSDINFFEPLISKIAKVEKFPSNSFINGDFISVIRNSYERRKESRRVKKLYEIKHRILVSLKTKQVYEDVIDINDNYILISDKEIYFTRYSPTCYNVKLMKKDLASGEETEILDNIYNVVEIDENKVFYIVGNTKKQSLFVLDLKSNEKKQIFERYVGYLMHKDGYFYVYRGTNLNKTLFKVSDNGEESHVLARKMGQNGYTHFSKNGYFYYENYEHKLIRIRLDGSNETVIAKNLEHVIKVDNKYVYYSCKETVDAMFNEGKGKKYLQGLSIYRYNSETNSSEKVIFNLAKWKYIANRDELYVLRRSEEVYRSTNMRRGKNFGYPTIIENYSVINMESLAEQTVLTFGLPDFEKRGCFLFRIFRKNKDKPVAFEKEQWERPYLTKKEELYK